MQDWDLWLSCSNTREVVRALRKATEELRDLITDGSHIQKKNKKKISLDYIYSLGQLDGMRTVIEMIEDVKETMEESDGN